jgi:hypothetical protein
MKLTENQQKVLKYVKEHSEGVTAYDARWLFEGDVQSARSVLHQLANKKQIKKRVVRQPRVCLGGDVSRMKIAIFYPLVVFC